MAAHAVTGKLPVQSPFLFRPLADPDESADCDRVEVVFIGRPSRSEIERLSADVHLVVVQAHEQPEEFR